MWVTSNISCHSMKHTKEHFDHTHRLERVWNASLLFKPPPRLLWTTQLSLPDVLLYCKKHIITKHASFVHTWGFVRAHVSVCAFLTIQTWCRDRGWDGGGVSSTSANWILPKRDSDEVLFIAAVIVSIFTPVHEYYSRPARSTGRNPSPSQLIY